jgi:GntR family transcriptional regulator
LTETASLDLANRLSAEMPKREDLVAQVCGRLRKQLHAGDIATGTKLPSETELARTMGVSRPTLREATRILAQEGLLSIRHGVGTFVASRTPHLTNALDAMQSLTASIRAAGGEPRVRGLKIDQVPATREVADVLGLRPRAEVIRIRRIRLMDDRPLGVAVEYLALAPPVDLAAVQGFDGSSLYGFLAQRLGLSLMRSEVAVTAVSANTGQARDLAVKSGAPLLLMREIHFGTGDRRVLYSINAQNSAVVDLTIVRAGLRT